LAHRASLDTAPFLSENFDVNIYANSVLSGRAYRPDDTPETGGTELRKNGSSSRIIDGDKGDVSLELARLNYGIVS
jgi:hypothetical protein